MISPSPSVTSILLAVVLLLSFPVHPALQAQEMGPARFTPRTTSSSVSPSAARPAFLFTENLGQWDGGARFQGTAGSATVRFDARGVSYCYLVDSAAGASSSSSRYHLLRTEFLDARPDARLEGSQFRIGERRVGAGGASDRLRRVVDEDVEWAVRGHRFRERDHLRGVAQVDAHHPQAV